MVLATVPTITLPDLRQALRRTGHAELSMIDVTLHGGRVSLNGRVSSFYLKSLAQTSVQSLPGVTEVQNEVRVGPVGLMRSH